MTIQGLAVDITVHACTKENIRSKIKNELISRAVARCMRETIGGFQQFLHSSSVRSFGHLPKSCLAQLSSTVGTPDWEA